MKKILLLFVFLLLLSNTYSQKIYAWWDVGLKTSYGLTGLINTKLFDDKIYEHNLSAGYGIGGKFGFYFGLFNGITVDFMLSGNKQKFDYTFDNTQGYIHSLKWNNYDLAVLYRMQKDGVYLELGPQISFLRKVTNEDSRPGSINGDVSSNFTDKYFSGIFGVGGYILNYETFTLMAGFRLGYGFTDLVNATGKENNFPTPSQQDRTRASSDVSTNPAFVQIVLEANLALGYYGRTSCSKRASIFSFD
ncbi:MAG: hypothetical protein IPH93_06335 [Saprospiraceae bacterium]|nr:hypothetical protein [Saprospiraceae bacterium]MBK7811288.1 hypothetical protein [Saprospiraceae bacterium]MBK9631009.1 hypothetical protein [Saprospiraceae bacterium]